MKECSEFTPWLKKLLESDGAIIIPMVAGTIKARGRAIATQSGWPDRLIWHRSWRGFLEVKVDGNQLSPRQRHNIQELNRRQPGSAFVVRGFSDGSKPRVETSEGDVIGEFQTAAELLTLCTTTRS